MPPRKAALPHGTPPRSPFRNRTDERFIHPDIPVCRDRSGTALFASLFDKFPRRSSARLLLQRQFSLAALAPTVEIALVAIGLRSLNHGVVSVLWTVARAGERVGRSENDLVPSSSRAMHHRFISWLPKDQNFSFLTSTQGPSSDAMWAYLHFAGRSGVRNCRREQACERYWLPAPDRRTRFLETAFIARLPSRLMLDRPATMVCEPRHPVSVVIGPARKMKIPMRAKFMPTGHRPERRRGPACVIGRQTAAVQGTPRMVFRSRRNGARFPGGTPGGDAGIQIEEGFAPGGSPRKDLLGRAAIRRPCARAGKPDGPTASRARRGPSRTSSVLAPRLLDGVRRRAVAIAGGRDRAACRRCPASSPLRHFDRSAQRGVEKSSRFAAGPPAREEISPLRRPFGGPSVSLPVVGLTVCSETAISRFGSSRLQCGSEVARKLASAGNMRIPKSSSAGTPR